MPNNGKLKNKLVSIHQPPSLREKYVMKLQHRMHRFVDILNAPFLFPMIDTSRAFVYLFNTGNFALSLVLFLIYPSLPYLRMPADFLHCPGSLYFYDSQHWPISPFVLFLLFSHTTFRRSIRPLINILFIRLCDCI